MWLKLFHHMSGNRLHFNVLQNQILVIWLDRTCSLLNSMTICEGCGLHINYPAMPFSQKVGLIDVIIYSGNHIFQWSTAPYLHKHFGKSPTFIEGKLGIILRPKTLSLLPLTSVPHWVRVALSHFLTDLLTWVLISQHFHLVIYFVQIPHFYGNEFSLPSFLICI